MVIIENNTGAKTMRQILIDTYLDYTNNYLTIEKYAEHNGLTTQKAYELLCLAQNVFDTKHPEA